MTFPLKIVGLLKSKSGGGIPTDGLIGEWLFSGNANDTSGQGNNGTVSGASLTTDRKSQADSAYYFDGSSGNYISMGDKNLFTFANASNDLPFCFSFWVYPQNFTDAIYIISKNAGTAGNKEYIFGLDSSGRVYSQLYGQNSYLNYLRWLGNAVLSLNTWHHIVIQYDGSGNLYVYTNNVLNSLTLDDSGTYVRMYNTIASLYMGRYQSGTVYYNGKLDDVRLYNRLLTSGEITALYNE